MPMLDAVILDTANYDPFTKKEVDMMRKGYGKNSYVESMKLFKEHGHDDPGYLAWREEQEGPWWKALRTARDRYNELDPTHQAINWFIAAGVYPFAEEREAGPESEKYQVAFYNAAEAHWHTRPDPVWTGFRAEVPLVGGGLSINWAICPDKAVDAYRETAVRLVAEGVRQLRDKPEMLGLFWSSLTVKSSKQLT